jgi:hypothetical protein
VALPFYVMCILLILHMSSVQWSREAGYVLQHLASFFSDTDMLLCLLVPVHLLLAWCGAVCILSGCHVGPVMLGVSPASVDLLGATLWLSTPPAIQRNVRLVLSLFGRLNSDGHSRYG